MPAAGRSGRSSDVRPVRPSNMPPPPLSRSRGTQLHPGRPAARDGPAAAVQGHPRDRGQAGGVLLERTTRSVALTAAGAVLLEEARAALEAVAAAGHRAARAGQPDRRLVVAIKADGDGGQLPAIIAAYERDRPPCRSWSRRPAGAGRWRCCTTRPTCPALGPVPRSVLIPIPGNGRVSPRRCITAALCYD